MSSPIQKFVGIIATGSALIYSAYTPEMLDILLVFLGLLGLIVVGVVTVALIRKFGAKAQAEIKAESMRNNWVKF